MILPEIGDDQSPLELRFFSFFFPKNATSPFPILLKMSGLRLLDSAKPVFSPFLAPRALNFSPRVELRDLPLPTGEKGWPPWLEAKAPSFFCIEWVFRRSAISCSVAFGYPWREVFSAVASFLLTYPGGFPPPLGQKSSLLVRRASYPHQSIRVAPFFPQPFRDKLFL